MISKWNVLHPEFCRKSCASVLRLIFPSAVISLFCAWKVIFSITRFISISIVGEDILSFFRRVSTKFVLLVILWICVWYEISARPMILFDMACRDFRPPEAHCSGLSLYSRFVGYGESFSVLFIIHPAFWQISILHAPSIFPLRSVISVRRLSI